MNSCNKEYAEKQDKIWDENWQEAFEVGSSDGEQQGYIDGWSACLDNREFDLDPELDPEDIYTQYDQESYEEEYMQTAYEEGYGTSHESSFATGYLDCLDSRGLEFDSEYDSLELFDYIWDYPKTKEYIPKEYEYTGGNVPYDTSYDYSDLEFQSVDSSCFSEVAYDRSSGILVCRFKDSGALYYYYCISPIMFDDFMNSSSLGSYYNRNIKGNFLCYRLE